MEVRYVPTTSYYVMSDKCGSSDPGETVGRILKHFLIEVQDCFILHRVHKLRGTEVRRRYLWP